MGVTKNADGSYSSAVPDNVYGAQLYCPIADIEDADLAYAWWWVDLADDGGIYGGSMSDFERRLQSWRPTPLSHISTVCSLKTAQARC